MPSVRCVIGLQRFIPKPHEMMTPIERVQTKLESLRCAWLARKYQLPGGYKRIYFYHVRKTGGTSTNVSFLQLGGGDDNTYGKLANRKPYPRLILRDKVFVGYHQGLAQKGDYFYGYTHVPQHLIHLPPQTFTFTCLRHPVKRFLSLYKHFLHIQQTDPNRYHHEAYSAWFQPDFDAYLDVIPRKVALEGLAMFSSTLDVDEAYTNIQGCNFYFFTEQFADGIRQLGTILGVPLEPVHTRSTPVAFTPSAAQLARVEEMLAPELALYERVKAS